MTICAYLAGHNLFVDLDRLISEKGRVTSSHFIDENSQCPPVHSFVVALQKSETQIIHQGPKAVSWCWSQPRKTTS